MGRHATADDIVAECARLQQLSYVADYELLRIYYYDAPLSSEELSHPVSKQPYKFALTGRYQFSQALHDRLRLAPHFALRRGETILSQQKWKLKPKIQEQIIKTPRQLTDDDFTLDLSQKGVDMRVGLDMARLALKERCEPSSS